MNLNLNHNPGRTLTYNGAEYLYFGGTSYLGLQTHPEFLKCLSKNILSFGSSHGASRNSNVQLEIYEQTEAKLAQFCNAEACLTTSSGFMAGQIVRDYFNRDSYECFHYPQAHAALRTAIDFKFETAEDLRLSLLNYLSKKQAKKPVLFLDSISFSSHHFPDFKFLKSLPLERIILVADDSHGIGVVGAGGAGSYKILKTLDALDLVVCGSLAKALATPSGFILGNDEVLQEIRQGSIFAGASPAHPAAIATLGSSLKQISLQHQKLKANRDYFIQKLKKTDFLSFNPEHAGFNFDDQRLVNYLTSHRIMVTSFKYAGGGGEARLTRLVITATHTRDDLDKLIYRLHRYFDI